MCLSSFWTKSLKITQTCLISQTLFQHFVTNDHGGALHLSQDSVDFNVSKCSFIDNVVTEKYEGGAMYVIHCKKTAVQSCLFHKCSSYYSCATYITVRLCSDENTMFPVIMTHNTQTNSYADKDTYSHNDIVGGKNLHLHHCNYSNNYFASSGFFIDKCESATHDVISFLQFENQQSKNYFQFDQGMTPYSIYFDKINMINISTNLFFSDSCLERSPEFFTSNIITEKSLSFIKTIIFHDCFFSFETVTNGKETIFSSQNAPNLIYIKKPELCIQKRETCIIREHKYAVFKNITLIFLITFTSKP